MTWRDKQGNPYTLKRPPMSNKDICYTILMDAVDRARQHIWRQVQDGQLNSKKAETILINMDKALGFTKMFLHDQISGKDAKFITVIRAADKSVLMGHQAQQVYFSVGWDTLRSLVKQIDEMDDKMQADPQSVPKTVDMDVRKIQLENLKAKGLITDEEYKKYREELGLSDADPV